MFSYYSAITFLSLASLGILCLLVHENARIPHEDKGLLDLTYLLIALSAMAEYCGVRFSGNGAVTPQAMRFIKFLDYTCTPLAGWALVLQMRLKNRWNKALAGIIIFNTLLQFVSIFTGWMVTVDAHNHYAHGPLYPLYLGICIFIILTVLMQFILYGRSFRRQNRKSLYAVVILVLIGVIMQECSNGEIRSSYIALTLGASLLFIHSAEFSSQEMDNHLKIQKIQIETDAMTGVYSRHAYAAALKELDAAGKLPDDFVAFTVDINGLKPINDRLGHEAGDELICGAADCITKVLCKNGRCYRTGGDEFVVLTRMTRDEARGALRQLRKAGKDWQGNMLRSVSLSAGYAIAKDYEGVSAEKLVVAADKKMYEAKAAYYSKPGNERRKRNT